MPISASDGSLFDDLNEADEFLLIETAAICIPRGRLAWIHFWTRLKIRQIWKTLNKSITDQEIGKNQSDKLYEELLL
ncbi:hypothetical protein NG55_03870 [Acinetobacter gyllenbergii]|nr:hypothetical protein NG55_03870 [Acinetobacter gyllenbergii]